MENLVPNAVIAFRTLLTIPVSVASGECSFSKLKLIKRYLRNVMIQNRLSELSIFSIEKEIKRDFRRFQTYKVGLRGINELINNILIDLLKSILNLIT